MRKMLLACGIAGAFAVSGVSYASIITSNSMTASVISNPTVTTVAENTASGGPYGSKPAWNTFVEKDSRTLNAGDLFIINATNSTPEKVLSVFLYLENGVEMSGDYSTFYENIQVYSEENGTWKSVQGKSQQLSLQNGVLAFALSGGKKYAITVSNTTEHTSWAYASKDTTLQPKYSATANYR
ncbi:hypothetical protein [Ectobacillus ponti]|uniref:Uncharacterized protein n=1 Tax=Ectobacillus ponti TaxID=2961894 RepID=A0AA42BRY8_9BACI|nr:hypothetical protein [Ectobacillus ponti]MCP8970014.1 hypothetical protein [Ectobacillus ponti]